MKPRTVDGVSLTCGGDDSRGAVCFDPATGYVALAIRDTEKVAYETGSRLAHCIWLALSQELWKHELLRRS